MRDIEIDGVGPLLHGHLDPPGKGVGAAPLSKAREPLGCVARQPMAGVEGFPGNFRNESSL